VRAPTDRGQQAQAEYARTIVTRTVEESEALNLEMGRTSRERGPAPVSGKPWSVGGGESGDGLDDAEARRSPAEAAPTLPG
jgi:hypothetical protein